MQKPNLTKICRNVKTATVKHSPEILTGVGIAGMITTTVMAVRATPKAIQLLDEEKRRQQADKLEPMDVVKTAWKCYIPAAVTGTVSVVSPISMIWLAFLATIQTINTAGLIFGICGMPSRV